MGGYIASSAEVVAYIKVRAAAMLYHNSLSPIVSQQILTAFRVITGRDGTHVGRQKIERLISNSNFFRSEMLRLGLHVYGDFDSPIVPVLLYYPCKIAAFSRCVSAFESESAHIVYIDLLFAFMNSGNA